MYISAFPCNQFDLQEPGNNSEILNGIKYVRPGKSFEPSPHLHIYGKLEVNGKNAHPMYKFLKNACPATGDKMGDLKYFYWDELHTSDIVWNFEKFIVDRQGRPVYRFHPGAWNKGKFVEQYLHELLLNTENEGKNAESSMAVVQSPSNFVIQQQQQYQNISRTNVSDVENMPNTNLTSASIITSFPEPTPERPPFQPIPEPRPEPERGRPHG